MESDKTALYFQFFNEVGIIAQLSRAMMERELPNGLLISHFSVLNHLIRVQDGRTPVELASAFQVAKTTMTHTLSGLEKHGFVEMRANPKDGRSKRVWITEAGRDFRDEAIAALVPMMAEMVKEFPPGRLEEILPTLTEVRIYLDELRDKQPG